MLDARVTLSPAPCAMRTKQHELQPPRPSRWQRAASDSGEALEVEASRPASSFSSLGNFLGVRAPHPRITHWLAPSTNVVRCLSQHAVRNWYAYCRSTIGSLVLSPRDLELPGSTPRSLPSRNLLRPSQITKLKAHWADAFPFRLEIVFADFLDRRRCFPSFRGCCFQECRRFIGCARGI
jgi:hypothetical protein